MPHKGRPEYPSPSRADGIAAAVVAFCAGGFLAVVALWVLGLV